MSVVAMKPAPPVMKMFLPWIIGSRYSDHKQKAESAAECLTVRLRTKSVNTADLVNFVRERSTVPEASAQLVARLAVFVVERPAPVIFLLQIFMVELKFAAAPRVGSIDDPHFFAKCRAIVSAACPDP